jgi:hypothetical protein
MASPSNSAAAVFSNDPLADPSRFDIVANGQISATFPTDTTDGYQRKPYMSVYSIDQSSSSLTASTAVSLSNTRYLVTVQVRATGQGACTATVSVGNTLVVSGSNLQGAWTAITGYYTPSADMLNPTLTLGVTCPIPAPPRGAGRKRQMTNNYSGIGFGDVQMSPDTSSAN